jgi:hypothetical protein
MARCKLYARSQKINDLININDVPYCATNLGVWSCDLSVNNIEEQTESYSSDWQVNPQPAMTTVNIRSSHNKSIDKVIMTDIMGARVMNDAIIMDNHISCSIADLSPEYILSKYILSLEKLI